MPMIQTAWRCQCDFCGAIGVEANDKEKAQQAAQCAPLDFHDLRGPSVYICRDCASGALQRCER